MELAALLAQLERNQLVRALEQNEYLFKHALVQDTAYASLLKNERKRLHRAIGKALEREEPNAQNESAALLAKHFLEAGDDAEILMYATRAGDAEARIFAKAEALEHYRAALDAALRLDSERETIIALVTKLGRMYELRDEYTRALETYRGLIELARERNDARLELAGLLLQAVLRATPTALFDPRRGREICDRALALARALKDGAAEAKTLWCLLLLNGFTGNARAAVEYGEQSLALARQLNLKMQSAYTLNDLANYGYFAVGQSEKSRAASAAAQALWRDLEILPMLADNLNSAGVLEYCWGDYARAQVLSDQALEISERIGSLWGQGLARSFRGLRLIEAGAYGRALDELRRGYEIARQTGTGIALIAATNLALAYTFVGEIELGYRVIQIAQTEIEIPLYRAPAKAALAYLVFLRGEPERAQSILQDAHRHAQAELEFSYMPSIIVQGEIGLARGREAQVVEYMETLAAYLIQLGLESFIADADLYRGRALARLRHFAAARAAFERAQSYAARVGSRRALWQIYARWSQFERAQKNVERANELDARAYTLIDSIAATLPEEYRAGFLLTTQRE